MAETRIVYILNRFDPDSGTHLAYNARFVAALQTRIPVFLIVESGFDRPPPGVERTRAYGQHFRFPPLRFAELLVVLLCLRLRGWRSPSERATAAPQLAHLSPARPRGLPPESSSPTRRR